jgi:hypothetical protein
MVQVDTMFNTLADRLNEDGTMAHSSSKAGEKVYESVELSYSAWLQPSTKDGVRLIFFVHQHECKKGAAELNRLVSEMNRVADSVEVS